MDFLDQINFNLLLGEVAINKTFIYYFPRILTALVCGFIIGFEREVKNKASGLRTSILICMGSMIFSSIYGIVHTGIEESDPARIAAQIVSGVGFLGAGVILRDRGGIIGVTSAANIWVTASIGILIGVGLYPIAIISTIVTIFVLVLFRPFEAGLISKMQAKHRFNTYSCKIKFKGSKLAAKKIIATCNKNFELLDAKILSLNSEIKGEMVNISYTYSTREKSHQKFIAEVSNELTEVKISSSLIA